jgi:uncharacterized protein (TIGR02217 family)
MNQFDNVRLPDDIEAGASGGPEFQTTIVAMGNGTEQRNINWLEARASWDIGYGIQSKVDYSLVRNFFYARRGRGVGFRFKDWSDFELEDELIGLGTSTTGSDGLAAFQIIKTYISGSASYIRIITRPVTPTLVVRVDDVVKTLTTHYTIDYDTGIITFVNPHRPTTGQEVRVDVEFDTPVRFDVDKFNLSLEATLAGMVQSLPVKEILE